MITNANARQSDRLIYSGLTYKTETVYVNLVGALPLRPHPRNRIDIRLISAYESGSGPFFKVEGCTSSVPTIRIRGVPIGSPIIPEDGGRARACQLSTWTVNP
ncbi:hypothetical protein KM043_016127 [Ampulex compressa]|nr:hypothetical protein KM043_016127 [Ampulex compressa]